MKIQNLAVIFVIIMLPISLILTSYTQSHIRTLRLQLSYDTKLNSATYDALKSFQLNTFNSSTADLANSKLRTIEASANTFFNSISSNFNMSGYDKDILKDYVPALVYTMYDGYYIYSPYTNKLSENEKTSSKTYKEGEKIYGLKPYIYYSCRYIKDNIDVVITYALDNYITVQGKNKNGEVINISGYLIDNIEKNNNDTIKYRGIEIKSETLGEYINADNRLYKYVKVNGVKYYKDQTQNKWFSILNGQKYYDSSKNFEESNQQAKIYYDSAQTFKDELKRTGISELKTSDAVYENGYKKQGDVTLAEKLQWRRF